MFKYKENEKEKEKERDDDDEHFAGDNDEQRNTKSISSLGELEFFIITKLLLDMCLKHEGTINISLIFPM